MMKIPFKQPNKNSLKNVLITVRNTQHSTEKKIKLNNQRRVTIQLHQTFRLFIIYHFFRFHEKSGKISMKNNRRKKKLFSSSIICICTKKRFGKFSSMLSTEKQQKFSSQTKNPIADKNIEKYFCILFHIQSVSRSLTEKDDKIVCVEKFAVWLN